MAAKEDLKLEDCPAASAYIKEAKVKIGKDEALKIFHDQIDFNNELNLFIANQIRNKKVSSVFVIGALTRLSWELSNNDVTIQTQKMMKMVKGGR